MRATNGGDDWRWSCAIIALFCWSCCVISAIRAIVGSTGEFYSELFSWVEGVGNVDINENRLIVYGAISGGLG